MNPRCQRLRLSTVTLGNSQVSRSLDSFTFAEVNTEPSALSATSEMGRITALAGRGARVNL
jgi:hypothetical protein